MYIFIFYSLSIHRTKIAGFRDFSQKIVIAYTVESVIYKNGFPSKWDVDTNVRRIIK